MQRMICGLIAMLGIVWGVTTIAQPYAPVSGTSYTFQPNQEGASYYSNPVGMQSFYCYQNSSYIKVGMSVGEVLSACGTPKTQKKQKAEQMGKVSVKQWVYHVAPTATTTGFLQFSVGDSVTLSVTFKDNKVKVIDIGGQNAQSTSSVCDGPIAIGNTPAQVEASCGSPSVHNETYENVQTGIINEVEVWTYQPRVSDKMVTLTFINGLLDTIQQ